MSFKSKISCAAALLTTAAAFGAVPYTDDMGFLYRSTAYPPNLSISPRHPKFLKAERVMLDGKKAVRIPSPEGGKRFVGYLSVNGIVQSGKAPGTLVVTTEGAFNGEVAKAKYSLNYNRKGGANGSAGNQSIEFTAQPGKMGKSLEFTVPPEAQAIQYIFGFNGKPGSSWDISRLTFEFAPDVLTMKKGMPPHGQKPSRWGSKYCVSADCFFNTSNAKMADARTSVKIAYDDKNLYLGYVCSEPDMKVLSEKITKRDGNLWQDDCVEFFFFDPGKDVVKQFITNPIGTQFDIELAQAQAGDPYKGRPWDGEWTVKKWKNKNSWEVKYQ